jgi:hypothetical protein
MPTNFDCVGEITVCSEIHTKHRNIVWEECTVFNAKAGGAKVLGIK